MGTLARQAEIGIWVRAPEGGSLAVLGVGAGGGGPPTAGVPPLRGSMGITYGTSFRLCMQNPVIWCISGRKMVRSAVHNAFLNTSTIGTAFPRVPHRNDPGMKSKNVHDSTYDTVLEEPYF